jgi:hypothetical protein
MKPPPIRDQSESSQISQSQGFFSKLLEQDHHFSNHCLALRLCFVACPDRKPVPPLAGRALATAPLLRRQGGSPNSLSPPFSSNTPDCLSPLATAIFCALGFVPSTHSGHGYWPRPVPGHGSRQDWPEYCLFILAWFPPIPSFVTSAPDLAA